jgi:23S rRNA (guanine745-N1)-methyltransferase
VAKEAARLAAKRKGYGRYLVADINKTMPLADHSCHLLLNIFAPRQVAEFSRMLQPEGLLLIVIPTSSHLANLRKTYNLLAIQPEKEQMLIQQMQSHFSLQKKTALRFEIKLENKALCNLVQMTPSARHITAQTWQQIKKQTSFMTEASFEILQFSAKKETLPI